MDEASRVLGTPAGDLPLREYRLRRGGREWAILHTGAVLTDADETHVLVMKTNGLPYGVALWPSSIALAREVADREAEFSGRSVLELGSGTGLPGIVAASLGARVTQTDGDELVVRLCRRNGERNGARDIACRVMDWTSRAEIGRHDWILGADILYAEAPHADLREIFEAGLAPGGRVLLADPSRPAGSRFLRALEDEGWRMARTERDAGEGPNQRPINLLELTPPGPA